MQRKTGLSWAWNYLFSEEERRWPDPIFSVASAMAGTMIGLKKGLWVGVAVAVSVVVIKYVVYHFAFSRRK